MSEFEPSTDESYGSHVGARLRTVREAQGLSLAEVAERTRIPMRHLALIEDGNHAGLPAATYSAGFVKSYARLLGLDGETYSADFRAEMRGLEPARSQTAPYEPADPRRTPPASIALLTLLIAVVAGLGYLYWRGSHEDPVALAARGPDQPVATAAPTQSAAAAPVAIAPPPPTGGAVVVGASQDVWLKVADGGRTIFMGILKPGNTVAIPADAVAPMLTTGRPGVTTILVGATPILPVGDPDRAAKDVSLKAADLLARVAASPPAVQPPPGAPMPVTNSAAPD